MRIVGRRVLRFDLSVAVVVWTTTTSMLLCCLAFAPFPSGSINLQRQQRRLLYATTAATNRQASSLRTSTAATTVLFSLPRQRDRRSSSNERSSIVCYTDLPTATTTTTFLDDSSNNTDALLWPTFAFSDDIIPILPETTRVATNNEDRWSSTSLTTTASTAKEDTDSVEQQHQRQESSTSAANPFERILQTKWGPRWILLGIAAVYGTNFALGSLMNDALPSSAVTAARMTLAAAALAPFLPKIAPNLLHRAVLCGCCTATGYVTQSLALVDTDPARVSFLGAAIVLWCPLLEYLVDKQPMGWKDAPQTWIAAVLCLAGVGVLEMSGGGGSASVDAATSLSFAIGTGDVLALIQAVGFGTGCFLSAKMVREQPDQVLPVTSVLIAVTAVLAWIWCFCAGTTAQPFALLQDPTLHSAALAVLWTGLISTSLNFVVEISALRHVPSSEASVLLASEPVWAALFASLWVGETLGWNDYAGGALILIACLVNAIVKPTDIHKLGLPWFVNNRQ